MGRSTKKSKTKNKNKNSDSTFSLVTNFISTFITTIVVIVAVFLVALRVFSLNAFNVESSSMTPAYPVNSLVIVKDTPAEEIQVGDTVTYVLNADGVLVTHRVVDIDTQNQTFTTKGDANPTADPNPVLWGNVVGKVVFHVPYVGKPLSAVTAEENRTAVIIAIVILGIISFSWDMIEKKLFKRKRGESGAEETDGAADLTDSGAPCDMQEDTDKNIIEAEKQTVRIGEIIDSQTLDNPKCRLTDEDIKSFGKEDADEKK